MASPFDSLSPLPTEIRQALVAMSAVGLTSLATAGLLFFHITYKLVSWKMRDIRNQKEQLEQPGRIATRKEPIDLNMGLAEDHYYQAKGRKPCNSGDTVSPSSPQEIHSVETKNSHGAEGKSEPSPSTRREKPPNPLLILIYNLILSDVALSASYANDAVWLAMDGIIAPSPTCTAQGWIVSWGCLTTSGFLLALSVFSYLGIIRGYKATTRDVIITCSILWFLTIILASLGPMYLQSPTFYGRETTWCWISEEYRLWRLAVYVPGFLCIGATQCIYSFIFYKLWREGRSSRFMPRRPRSLTATVSHVSTGRDNGRDSTALRPSGHHPAFLIYPCIYTITGTPLMLGSLIPTLERNPRFMGAAGTLLALTGLLDTILWSSIVLFSKSEDLANTGLDQFSFMRTPEGRTLGNIVFVQGGEQGTDRRATRQSWHSRKEKGWWRLGDRTSSSHSISQEWNPELEDGNRGIQMEVVTSVVIEREGSTSHARHSSRNHRGTSSQSSV